MTRIAAWARKRPTPTITDLLRKTVAKSGVPLLVLERETGIKRAANMWFVRGEQTLRLDKADALAEYFGLELVRRGDMR